MSRQRSIIEQRILWTHFRRQTDKDVLLAMARWFCWRADGTCRPFVVEHLAEKARTPKRSTERALERLEADWYLEVTARRHRQPTLFRINLARLATEDPERLTARVADKNSFDRQSGGQDLEWRTRNGPDSEKVADQRSEEEVREEVRTPTSSCTEERDRQSGGQIRRPEHPDVAAFLAWARVTYPQHANGAQLELDGDRRRYVVHRLLEQYGRPRLDEMALACWTIEADADPASHASWIARSDRSLYVLKHKAAFLERVVVGAQQLNLGPMVTLSERELADAREIRLGQGGCRHDPPHDNWKECVRAIALARHIG